MACEWGRLDCANEGTEACDTCWSDSYRYKQAKLKKRPTLARRQQKQDARMGSGFESQNHKHVREILKQAEAETHMTLNSGATQLERGDEQLTGILEVMEELKTQMPDRIKGTKSFSIKRAWLDDLHQKAKREHKEAWYLKFAFSEDEAFHDGGKVFTVMEQDVIDKLLVTVISDRKVAKTAVLRIEVAENQRAKAEAELELVKRENELLKSQLKLMEAESDVA